MSGLACIIFFGTPGGVPFFLYKFFVGGWGGD